MFVEQPAHPAQGQTEQPHQNTGHRARKIQPDVGELAAPAIAEHLDGLVRQSREQTAQDRPRDVNEKVPGIDPQAESEQEAFQRILAEMCQLAHDVVCQMVRHAGHSQTGEHLFHQEQYSSACRFRDVTDLHGVGKDEPNAGNQCSGKDHPPRNDPQRGALRIVIAFHSLNPEP